MNRFRVVVVVVVVIIIIIIIIVIIIIIRKIMNIAIRATYFIFLRQK